MVNIRPEMDERMEINILDYRLKVMSISKSAISKFTYALLDVLFLKHYLDESSNGQHGFVSITQTDDDYSIVIEEEAFKAFDTKSKDLKINEQTWLPLVASTGPSTSQNAVGISKIADSVVIPLADQGISVYPLSTYRTDYVLIQEADFNTACEVLARDFRITREGVLDSLEIIVDPLKVKPAGATGASNNRPLTHSFDCNSTNTYCITSMDIENLRSQALTIMDMLFYSGVKPATDSATFFNMSIIDQDISLVLNVTLLDRFPPNLLFNNSEYWHLITIGDMPEGVGFREAGIVAQISEPIASAQISEYYISSFYYGHALVPVEHFDKVETLLIKRRSQMAADASLSKSL